MKNALEKIIDQSTAEYELTALLKHPQISKGFFRHQTFDHLTKLQHELFIETKRSILTSV